MTLVLTMGDPAGIGGEITLKSWIALRETTELSFAVIADADWLALQSHRLGLGVPLVTVASPADATAHFGNALPVLHQPLAVAAEPGAGDVANGPAVRESIDRAVAYVRRGEARALVTNPINKRILYEAGFRHPGHTEYLAELCGGQEPVMLLAGGGLRVVPVTVHLPLAQAAGALSTGLIVRQARLTAEGLARRFGIAAPRLAIAALNPHAGEGGTIGREEIEIIAPAVAELQAAGIDATGPHPADTLFHPAARDRFDAVVCMYHDQALIPLKTIAFDDGVNVTLGLPIVRTSPDHGTAFDIAGRGVASAGSLIAAIRLAGELSQRKDAA